MEHDFAADRVGLGQGECPGDLGQRELGADLGGQIALFEEIEHCGQVFAQAAPEGRRARRPAQKL